MRGIRPHTYTNGNCYTDANSYSYGYGHAYTYTNAIPMLRAVYTDAATSPHPSAAPVALVCKRNALNSARLACSLSFAQEPFAR